MRRKIKKKKVWSYEEKYLLTTFKYIEHESPHTWRIDLVKVELASKTTEKDQEAYCLEYLSRAFTYAMKKRGKCQTKNWERDLPSNLYPPYGDTAEVLHNIGLWFYHEIKTGMKLEESIDLWHT